MLTRLEKAQAAWGGADSAIDKWLADRESVLVQYCKLAGLKPFEHERQLPDAVSLKDFCAGLLDYTSAGHFEMYDKLVDEENPEAKQLAAKVYPGINASTDIVLNFNDRYGEVTADDELASLDDDLSQLGEALSQRFELEDSLIENLASASA
ncbi:sigma D regulator [Neiella sp. HB171785]|uniref:Sigma D regulator n=1 Tax=Neiella litorisoli TaxID=2771431 RepID=A0A8J6QTI8_9GAMM|nr:sigma D regulator [Neiella litorisoli]MBD1387973.1 sigma D regulator [Neiella litorisoli]